MHTFTHLSEKQHYPQAALYIVATPIGNLADITLRALHVLQLVDYIACEDTRHTNQLLQAYGIQAKTLACHQHNQQEASQTILGYLKQNLRIAYVSDAGTPGISDPGSILVQNALNAGFQIIPIGGISTPTTLMSVAGQFSANKNDAASSNYYFAGFLPHSTQTRQNYLKLLSSYTMPIVLFESPKRIQATLQELQMHFMHRKLVIGREISKQFESIQYTHVGDASMQITQKGEFCLIIDGCATTAYSEDQVGQIMQLVMPYLGSKQSSIALSKILNISQKDLYQIALNIKKNSHEFEE
jgi:16S rRNA (cytidine1402-2'-O)-methyltransferase